MKAFVSSRRKWPPQVMLETTTLLGVVLWSVRTLLSQSESEGAFKVRVLEHAVLELHEGEVSAAVQVSLPEHVLDQSLNVLRVQLLVVQTRQPSHQLCEVFLVQHAVFVKM